MGFRNPITTADAVDTGRGVADAGVRLYQDLTVPAVPQGVAEWRTGTMTRNATAKISGGGSGGSSFELDGGNTLGVDAPKLDLNVESLPAGGYGPVARLRTGGGQAFTDAPILQDTTRTALALVTIGTFTFSAFDANNPPKYARLSSGEVSLEGIAKLAGGTIAAGGQAVVGNLPAGLVPSQNVHRPCLILTSAGAYFGAGWLIIGAGSTNVVVVNTSNVAFGPGASFGLGCTFSPATSLT